MVEAAEAVGDGRENGGEGVEAAMMNVVVSKGG